ncbi:hypothetical protein EH223_08500 [candidate division KSB1 bacterium]|nr:MAG: hypothetical protein EH223_08500 [candidate division KSB1 bacterium]
MSKKRKRRSCKRYAVRRYRGDGGAVEFMGADTLRRGDIGKMVSDIGVPVLGGLGGVLLGNSVPVKNPTLRAFSPLFAALVLAFIAGKSKAMRAVSLGMAVVGGANGVRALAGGRLPLLAGDPVEFAPAFPLAMSGDEIDQAVADGQITADEADVLRATSTYTGLAQDDGAAAESPFSMAGVRGGADYVLQDEI